MKNKTIKKLTKGIVAIALTIATVVGAGVIGAQEYNAYTTETNSCGTYVNELADATGNYNYSPAWRDMAMWCNMCYSGDGAAKLALQQEGCVNPNATGEDGVAQYILGNGGTFYQGNNSYDRAGFIEKVVLDNGLCIAYIDQFKAKNLISQTYQVPAKYAKLVTTNTATTTMIDNFDATFYANMYPDVKKAIGTDATKLYNHYVTYGKAEGRYANQMAYNAAHKTK